MNGPKIVWLDPKGEVPQRTAEGDAQSWEVWVDMTGTPWSEHTHFPYALLCGGMGEFEAHTTAQRMYELYGTERKPGVRRVG